MLFTKLVNLLALTYFQSISSTARAISGRTPISIIQKIGTIPPYLQKNLAKNVLMMNWKFYAKIQIAFNKIVRYALHKAYASAGITEKGLKSAQKGNHRKIYFIEQLFASLDIYCTATSEFEVVKTLKSHKRMKYN